MLLLSMLKLPDSYRTGSLTSLILETLLRLFVLPLLFPIDTKDEQSQVKIALCGISVQGEHWSTKLKYLLLLSFNTETPDCGIFFIVLLALHMYVYG